MTLGDSHIRVGASRVRPPWPIVVTLMLAFLMQLLQLWPRIQAGVFSGPAEIWFVNTLVQVWFRFLFIALLAHGLWRGSRFVHIVAILWLAEVFGLGVYTMISNDHGWSYFVNFASAGFYYGALPIMVGVAGLVLLALPVSWSWTSHHRRSLRH